MKLVNKKTGERGIINYFDNQNIVIYPIDENWNAKGDKKYILHSLAELNAEWEDYEEAKYYYAITSIKEDDGITKMKNKHNDMTAFDKAIGNYFETREEAEKAVEKLKAFKRLKDKGFRFDEGKYYNSGTIEIKAYVAPVHIPPEQSFLEDLNTCFGGEE